MRLSWLAAGLVLCAAVAILAWQAKGRGVSSASLDAQAGISDAGEQRALVLPELVADRHPMPQEGAMVERIRGRVLSTERLPLEGVTVHWFALHKEDTESNPAWPDEAWGISERASVETVSRADGGFAFPKGPSERLAFGSALIATDPGHWAGGLDLDADPSRWPEALEIVLADATPISVRVVDAAGQVQPGASVHHFAGPSPSESASHHESFCSQRATTDASGEVVLSPFRGEQVLWAEKGELVSSIWQGPCPAEVVLRLGASFTIDGSVSLPDRTSWDPDCEGERRLVVLGMSGSLWRPLVRLRGIQEGSFGPLRIPLEGSARYRVRLEGAPIVPREVLLERPRAGSRQRVDFVCEKQSELWFYVADEREQPLANATAVVWWGATDNGPEHVLGASQTDGYLYTGTFPPGQVQYRITAPGFAQVESYIDVPIDSTIPVTLGRGGRIVGHCKHAGSPLADFEIVYWKQVPDLRIQHHAFLGHEDGGFELEHLSPGDWSLYATSPGFPSGPPSVVTVGLEKQTEVELDLPASIRGGGREA